MPSVALYTLGCKVSQYETEAVAERFAERGFTVLAHTEPADVYVINTCTVTAESDRKSRQIVRRMRTQNPDAVVCVMGCYSQRSPDEVLAVGADIVVGTADKLKVVDLACEVLGGAERGRAYVSLLDGADFEKMQITRAPRTRAYVKIEDGCEAKCTYCAISAARGPVRSKAREDVIREVEGLCRTGVREIVLTGIETGSYGRDFDTGYGLADLILELDRLGFAERIRLGSLAPELVGADFARRVAEARTLAPHFHLSVQSGSDRVLAGMKRRYNRAMALANIRALKQHIPGACFTTDLMVGFPGESEEDFLDTVSFVREVGFIACHVFAYSRRAGTPAADYPNQIPEAVKRRRSAELIAVAREVRDGVLDGIVARREPLGCILETYDGKGYTAHSDEFAEVYVEAKSGLEGEYVTVCPLSHNDGIVMGEIVGNSTDK